MLSFPRSCCLPNAERWDDRQHFQPVKYKLSIWGEIYARGRSRKADLAGETQLLPTCVH